MITELIKHHHESFLKNRLSLCFLIFLMSLVACSADETVQIKHSQVIIKTVDGEISGLLINPAPGNDNEKFPAILLLQPPDESPDQWKPRMEGMALCGYAVMAVSYNGYDSAERALKNLLRIPVVDPSRIAVIGFHEGVEKAMLLAIRNRNLVKCLVSISGRPPDKIAGKDPEYLLACPILLIGGAADTRVPLSMAQFFYYKYCLDMKKPGDIYIMQNTRDFFSDAEWEMARKVFMEFLDRYMGTVIELKEKND